MDISRTLSDLYIQEWNEEAKLRFLKRKTISFI